MNILIYNTYKVYETQGGTERISARIARGFTQKGHLCYLAYKVDSRLENPEACFKDEINTLKKSIEDFVINNNIDVVIIQKMTREVILLYDIRKKNGLSFKIITVFHFAPAFEEYNLSFKSFCFGLFHFAGISEYLKDVIRTFLFPFYKLLYPLRNRNLYRTVYRYSDNVVLLSRSFITQYYNYAKLKDTKKFFVIPNALSFDEYFDERKLAEKKKQVLLVSRLVENPKKVSLAFQIWAEIEKEQSLKDWNFKIVGDGPDRGRYERMVRDLNLQRIEFCGRQNPQKYYEESRIFMMTSAFEGWGLTLTEAQQFGCVPIAFDTYSSVHDIIDNGVNGYIVAKWDVDGYVEKIKLLMDDAEKFQSMASNAIESSKRFDLKNIMQYWNNLIG